MVWEAGGTVLDDVFVLPGGFLYELPLTSANPLVNSTGDSNDSKITVSAWIQFPKPHFGRHEPYSFNGAAKAFTTTVSATASERTPQRRRSCKGEGTKKRISSWLSGLARDYGGAVDYLQ